MIRILLKYSGAGRGGNFSAFRISEGLTLETCLRQQRLFWKRAVREKTDRLSSDGVTLNRINIYYRKRATLQGSQRKTFINGVAGERSANYENSRAAHLLVVEGVSDHMDASI